MGDGSSVQARLTSEQIRQALVTTFLSVEDAVFFIGPERRVIVSCNESAERMFGYGVDELLGRTTELLHVDRARFEAFSERSRPVLEAQGTFRGEFRMRRRDGSTFESMHVITLLRREQGVEGGLVSIVKDMSEIERLGDALHEREQALLHAQRLETVGRMVGTVVHDLNNYLTALRGHLELLLSEPLGERVRELLGSLRDGATRASSLMRRLTSLARSGEGRLGSVEPVDVDACIGASEELLRASCGAEARVELTLAAGGARVAIDPVELDQVLLNLLVNARDALDGAGGTIELVTGPPDAEGRMSIVVRDDGPGMDRETMARAFEPFFTTKPEPRGTGLGLAAVADIVRARGGSVALDGAPGAGTACTIRLPVAAEAGAEAPAPPAAAARVIVFEPDASLRSLLVRTLEDAGYAVRAVARAEELPDALADDDTPVAVVDVAVHAEEGVRLLRGLRERRPASAAVVTVGSAAVPPELRRPGVRLLGKPYAPGELLRVLRTLE